MSMRWPGTEYDYGNTEEVPVTYADGTSGTVTIAGEKTSIYTAAGAYTDTVRVDSILLTTATSASARYPSR